MLHSDDAAVPSPMTAISSNDRVQSRTRPIWECVPRHFASGAIALSTAFAVTHPLDSFKTCIQAGTFINSNSNTSGIKSIKSSLNFQSLRTATLSLYKGFGVSVVGAAGQGGLRLATYEATKTSIKRFNGGEDGTQKRSVANAAATSAIAAIAGDTVSSIVKVPREVVTARLQTGFFNDLIARNPSASPTWIAINSIVKREGIPGLFRGFWPITARDWPFMVILFSTYETLKMHHDTPVWPSSQTRSSTQTTVAHCPDEISKLKSTLFGGLSGGLAGFMTTPFDVVRTRIMTDKTMTSRSQSIASIICEISHKAVSERAVGRPSLFAPVAPFFKGALPRSVWWFCVCSIFFPMYECSNAAFLHLGRIQHGSPMRYEP
eukprot:jgi/Hompol1/2711/HPOL_003016-RA